MKRNISLLLVILLIISLVGCASELTGSAKEEIVLATDPVEEYPWGFSRNQFKAELNLWEKGKNINWADAIKNGELYVNTNIGMPVTYNMETFDWNMEETSSPATFQLYLQSLGMVKFLTYAALETRDPSYLICAQEFIESWNEYAHDAVRSSGNTKVWYDHGSALRTNNIIYYILASEELGIANNSFRASMYAILVEHGEFLCDEDNYRKNHNHGIYQDEALFYIAAFIPEYEKSTEWMALAKERTQKQLEYAFTAEYVHVENSAGYCGNVINLFYNISQFLLAINDPYGQALFQNILDMTDYYARCFLPAGYFYALGDSFLDRGSNRHKKNYGNSFLEYVQSEGASGSSPDKLSAFYPQSGYFFTQETYEKDCLNAATWVMFKAGYVSKTHKYADDLSIALYSKGHEVFIDPGMYNYVRGNVYRDYLLSPRAHNTINVDGMTYSTTMDNSEKTGLLQYKNEDGVQYVLGYNDMYPGVEIDRHFYSLNDAIILFDDIHSDENHTYSQLFHLSEDMKVLSLSSRETILQIADTEYTVHIRQYGQVPQVKLLRNEVDENGLLYGIASDSLNEWHEINTLKYDVAAKDFQFVTVITIENGNDQVKLTNADAAAPVFATTESISYNSGNRMLTIGEKQITLTSRAHTNINDVRVKVVNDILTVEPEKVIDGIEYLWYLVDQETGKTLHKSSWSADGKASFALPEEAVLLKGYTKDSYDQRRNSIVGGWSDKQSGRKPMQPEMLNYRHLEDRIEKTGDNTYLFTAGTDYALNYSIRWYVYKNGSYFTDIVIENDNKLEQIWTEPGYYTVSYYFRNQYKKNEYWSFPGITIS